MGAETTLAEPGTRRVIRIEVRPKGEADDPLAHAVERQAAELGIDVGAVRTAKIYLIEPPRELSDDETQRLASGLLADPVTEQAELGASEGTPCVEVHPLPGVMDPVAESVEAAARELLGLDPTDQLTVSTGMRYEMDGADPARAHELALKALANPVIQRVHEGAFWPEAFPHAAEHAHGVNHVPVRELDDAALEKLSRDAHLFLSLDEMRQIRAEYRHLKREPTEIELETLAQTWSEHCVHKTLKSTIAYTPSENGPDPITWEGRPGHTVLPNGTIAIDNLLKSTVAAATHELIEEGVDWTLSVFVDNAGIIKFTDDHAVCVKVETHNHPSAIEPYGGAATGIGGCIRDIIGTGLAADPIASTDVFCVAPPDMDDVPEGCLHPRRILTQVVGGVRDYGNRMGIPTLNGAVAFDERYVGNPLVYCGCIGIMPSHLTHGDAVPGDLIVALGGRTGRDGIHGATFSSAELTDTHADEFAHAVQIGNPITEKRVLDAILRARDEGETPLYTAITDCGAGGFSSAVGEMGEKIGAHVQLDAAPLKYDGLSPTEIWISEAQERMVLSVPGQNLAQLREICREESVELAVLGTFGAEDEEGAELILNYEGEEYGRLPMAFLHDGIPQPTRKAAWGAGARVEATGEASPDATTCLDRLTTLLADPNVASKHWIIRQYDHEVKGNTVARPLGGALERGPMDASVIRPVPGVDRGLAIGCGLATGVGDAQLGGDPYLMALCAIDECVRNLVCSGADPDRIAILDNFCWPSCAKEENLGSLVRACEGCYDGAKAYRTPFVSGKDSLNNQFRTDDGRVIEIPPTLLITGIGIVQSLKRIVSSDAKRVGNALVLLSGTNAPTAFRGSLYQKRFGMPTADGLNELPHVDLERGPATAKQVHELISAGLVRAAHDISDAGVIAAVAEMLIAGSSPNVPLGATLDAGSISGSDVASLFGEAPSQYVLEVAPDTLDQVRKIAPRCLTIGELTDTGSLELSLSDGSTGSADVEALAAAWLGTLDW